MNLDKKICFITLVNSLLQLSKYIAEFSKMGFDFDRGVVGEISKDADALQKSINKLFGLKEFAYGYTTLDMWMVAIHMNKKPGTIINGEQRYLNTPEELWDFIQETEK